MCFSDLMLLNWGYPADFGNFKSTALARVRGGTRRRVARTLLVARLPDTKQDAACSAVKHHARPYSRSANRKMTLDSRQMANWLMSGLAILALLVVGRPFLVPLTFAVLAWAVLNALTRALTRFRLPLP